MEHSGTNRAGEDREREKQPVKRDLRSELNELAQRLDELKVQYEQFFMALAPFAPEKEHRELKRFLRDLMRAPFKNSEIAYKLRTLETRYHTLNTYWQRVLRQREDGTYRRDIFKAELREKIAAEEAFGQTAQGLAERSMRELFRAYREALETQTGKKQRLNFEKFSKSLVQRAKEFKDKTGCTKVSFKVVVKEGKVAVAAKGK